MCRDSSGVTKRETFSWAGSSTVTLIIVPSGLAIASCTSKDGWHLWHGYCVWRTKHSLLYVDTKLLLHLRSLLDADRNGTERLLEIIHVCILNGMETG